MIRRSCHRLPWLLRYLVPALTVMVLLVVTQRCQSADGEVSAPSQAGSRAAPIEEVVPVNGTKIYTKRIGSGEPIVVVHGGPGFGHGYLVAGLSPLAADHQVVFYDQRSSGRSALTTVDADAIGQFVDDLEGLRQALGVERIHVLGHSFGGLVAMRYAMRFPQRVRSLLLVSSTAASSEYQDEVNRTMTARLSEEKRAARDRARAEALEHGDPAAMTRFLRIALSANFHDPGRAEALEFDLPDDFGPRSESLQPLFAQLGDFDVYPRLVEIDVPTLIVRSDGDALPAEATERIKDGIPGAWLETLPQCGHFSFVECPEALLQRLTAFLDTLDGT